MIKMSSKIGFFIAMLVGLMVFGNGPPAQADEVTGAQHLVSITKGGLLYDKWYGQLGVDAPKKTHPLYPAAGKQKGASTWRCKECHGWDYKGVHGAYSKGSHFTGITGLRNMTHSSVDKIVEVLSDKKHGYAGLIPKDAMLDLAHFVSHGQVDMDEFIDRSTKKARGDAIRGERIYQTTCVRCHGVDGKEINFKSPPKAEFIGTVANGNPWETLHKIRMGQPDVQMISMLAFDVQTHVDILAYTQTLPTK